MKNDIRTKLQEELLKPLETEVQVVYILTRVRKLLEIGKKEKEFEILKFYCDWALHDQIDRIKDDNSIKVFLKKVVAGDDGAMINHILFFTHFHESFLKFLKAFDLPTTIYSDPRNRSKLNRLLAQIYSDTPVILKEVKKTKITMKFQDSSKSGLSFSVGTTVEQIE